VGAYEKTIENVVLGNTCCNHVAGCNKADTGVGPS